MKLEKRAALADKMSVEGTPRLELKPAPEAESRASKWLYLELALVIVVVVAVYGRCLGYEFLSWDDDQNILKNRWFQPGLWQRFWLEPYLCLYLPPVYSIWYMLSAAASSPSPQLFHGANLVLHGLNSCLVYALVRTIFLGPKPRFVALLAALIFALHPLQVEAVAWITGFRDLLSATGALAAACGFLRGGRAGPSRRVQLLGWLAFVFAMLCKPSAVALPVALAAVAIIGLQRPFKAVLLMSLPWLAAVVPVIWVTQAAQLQIADTHAPVNIGQRLLVTLDSYGFYLQKLLLPLGLTSDYGRQPLVALASGLWPHVGLLSGLALLLWLGRKLIPRQSYAWVAFAAVVLLPNSGIVPFAFQHTSTVADHYAYLAMAGIATGLAVALFRLDVRISRILAPVLLIAWAVLASVQLPVWQSDETLFPAMVAANANSYAGWTGLAAISMRQKHFEEALTNIKQAERIDPLKVDLLANKGLALNELGRFDQVLSEIAPKLPGKQIVIASPVSGPSVSVMFMMVAYAHLKQGHVADSLPYLCMAQWADEHNSDAKTFLPIAAERLGRSLQDPNLCAPFIN